MYIQEEVRPAHRLLALATMALLIVLSMPAVTSAQGALQRAGNAAPIPTKAFECDSNIMLSHVSNNPGMDTEHTVTLEITNVDTQDAANAQVNQYYTLATYLPDCNGTTLFCDDAGGADPLDGANPPTTGVFVDLPATLGGTCMGLGGVTVTPNVLADRIEFTFSGGVAPANPNELTLAPPLPSPCTFTFDIVIPPGMTFDSSSVATADCRDNGVVPPIDSTTRGGDTVMSSLFCEDGVVTTPPETCDPNGPPTAPGACRPAGGADECTYCGDAVIQPGSGEECDDGNTVDGDGCDNDCTASDVPTLPGGALAILAMLLIAGSWMILRRRSSLPGART